MRVRVPWTLLGACACLTVIGFTACGGEDDKSDSGPEAGNVGSACELDGGSGCNADLECTARGDGAVCTHLAGAECNLDDEALDNAGCAEFAECKVGDAPGDGTGEGGASGEEGPTICIVGEGGACDPEAPFCDSGLVCAEIESGEHRCFAPLVFRGQVTDSSNGAAISDAHVIAIDDEGVAVSDVAESDAEGNYELEVPVVRDAEGLPLEATFTLRAEAQTYQPFPSGVRVALPISTSEAESQAGHYAVDNALTDITLIPLDVEGLKSISGRVIAIGERESIVGGVLVVASGDAGTVSAITDRSGAFTVFNVPQGSYELAGYAASIQLETESVSVGDSHVGGVELLELDADTTRVTGNIQIVNAPGSAVTSVILVVEDTFDADIARGEVPRGLRAPRSGAPTVSGDFVIEDVPAGRYVVLAAYENDDLVRDPDTSIGGTSFVTVEVSADQEAVALPASFKVTEALEVVGPGVDEPEAVLEKPVLTWADDSSEEWYEVRVFDAFGNEVWNDLMVPAVSGSKQVTLAYEGPLDPGMYYQFRVSSWSESGNGEAAPLSTTEDLRGVFYLPVP
ncbi:MAG TPA: carboxypeptidase-like regulatory domain-containing protein [Polyangiaceae bacterium]